MQCPQCRTNNREGRRFCAECGAPLSVACPDCGWQNEPGEKYCGGCGLALIPMPAATLAKSTTIASGRQPSRPSAFKHPSWHDFPEPERRQLTIMFCDLVDSTALSAQFDPEELREVIRAYQQVCAAVIARYAGVVARYMGDGIMAHFGYPQAHEDDPERAVRAGLGIIEAMAGCTAGRDKAVPPLAVRVGIATGLVVAGDLIGEGAAEEQAVVGETPNLAARLQGLASPNTVVIASSTQRLLGGLFEYEDLGCHELKGFVAPVRVWRVIRPRPTRSRFEAVHAAALTPLIGREEEVGLLLHRWEQAKQGEGQVVLLSGESGIGKSRLIEALYERIRTEPHIRMRFQCSPYHSNSALYPFIGQFEWAAKLKREDTAEQKLDKLEALLAKWVDKVEAVAPLFAALLSIPTKGRYAPLDLTPQQQKARTLAALVEQMESLAARERVLVVFEDIHWIDPTSQELLDRVIERAQSARVLVLITFRPDFLPSWVGQPHVTLVTLRRLNRCQRAVLVERLAHGKPLPGEVVEQIIAKTDGVPLFIEELTKTILTSGLLKEDAERYVLSGPLPPLAIPDTLQDSLMARLDRLASVKEVAQIGATIGREFSYELLAAVATLTEQRLQAALEQLTRAELISRRGMPPQAYYVFKHALLQEAAYESLLKSRRQQLHTRIAQVLEERFPERAEVEPELLAHHYTEAGLPKLAVSYWQRAGQRALERFANREVVGHVTKGLELLASLPDTPEHARQEIELQTALGAACWAIKGFASPTVEQSFKRARELCERVDASMRLIDILRGLYAYYLVRGELRTAREQAEQLLTLAQRTRDASGLVVGRYSLGAILFWQGEFVAARHELEEACSYYDPKEQHAKVLSGQLDPGVDALNHLSWTLWILGYPEQAIDVSEEAVATARKLSQPLTLAVALTWACWVRACCGQPAIIAETFLAELKTLTTEHSFAYLKVVTILLEAQALIARNQFEPGLTQIRQAWAEFQAQQATGLGHGWAVSIAVLAYSRLGKAEKGLKMVAEAFEVIERNGERHWKAELHRLQGELLLTLGTDNQGKGEACLRRALEVAQHQQAKSLELRAAISLARLLQCQGKNHAAKCLLLNVYGWFTEGFATADLKEAESLLEVL